MYNSSIAVRKSIHDPITQSMNVAHAQVSQALTPEDSGQCMEDKIKEKWAVLWDNKQVVELEFNSLMFSYSRYKILSKYFIKPSKLGVT